MYSKPTKPVDRLESDFPSIEPSVLEYQEIKGIPFAAAYLGLTDTFSHLPLKDRQKVNELNQVIIDKVATHEYGDSSEAARNILKDLEKKLGLEEGYTSYHRLDKLMEYLSVVRELPDPPKPEKEMKKPDRSLTIAKNRLSAVQSTLAVKERTLKQVRSENRSLQAMVDKLIKKKK